VGETESVFFCRATQLSFLRLITTQSVMTPYGLPPFTNEGAWSAYQSLIGDDRIVYRLEEPGDLERYWRLFAVRGTASPKLWMDAYLAAFARASGSQLVTNDRAFRQFPGLDLLLLGEKSI
jgi:toxin-antitoxin system PIN domain toxin